MTRDPKRIHRICEKLEKLWNRPECVDMRFGQLITFIYTGGNPDPFYTEDTLWEAMVDNCMKKLDKTEKM